MALNGTNGCLEDEHFAPSVTNDRVRSPRPSRNGRTATSPTHSAHGGLLRSSLMRIQDEKRAKTKKVRFYRNGDRYFKGMIYAVSPERFRTFESLMAELTSSPLGDRNILPNGVRHIFSLDGTKRISYLEELEEGESYVCASTTIFRKIDYPKSVNPANWNPNTKGMEDGAAPFTREMNGADEKEYIRPKLVTIIRNGIKPRKAVRVLLNKKTAHSFDQVLTDITSAIKLDSGAVRKIFTLDGRQLTSLSDFFQEESVFIAYGQEKYSLDDFDLDDNEIRGVSAYRSVKQGDRVTLPSPKAPRRISTSTRSLNEGLTCKTSPKSSPKLSRRASAGSKSPTGVGVTLEIHRSSPSSPSSPKANRRPISSRPKSPGRIKVTNGHSDGGNFDVPVQLSNKYRIGKVIGEGNFAVVKECFEKSKKREFALKIIDKSKCKGREQMIDNEVSILRKVKHPNIILLVEEFDTAKCLFLVMEIVSGGDLFDAISTATKYTERDASGMLFNLSSAIRYLHSLKIVHRDIKPENLLVCVHEDGSKSLKLGDFGLATEVKEPLFTVCGTPTYVAPEVIAEKGYELKVDVWAAGVITYILLCGFPPFVSATNDQEELFDMILSGHFEFKAPFWDDISNSAKELIEKMLQVDPDQRLSAQEVIEHAWVADDTAKDNDMHSSITESINVNFTRKTKVQGAGMAVIASTALDKQSRYFQGRGPSCRNEVDGHQEDEIF